MNKLLATKSLADLAYADFLVAPHDSANLEAINLVTHFDITAVPAPRLVHLAWVGDAMLRIKRTIAHQMKGIK